MLDFSKLRSQVDGYRGAFEGLVCQLARINPPEDATEFVKIEGAGGDGGLEAYWIRTSGDEQGYQAKFHTASKDIDWSKIDASVYAALASHPRMTRMAIAVACDLTDTVPGRRGKSAREKWHERRKLWQAHAGSMGRRVDFELWDASKIEALLASPEARGQKSYWFGEVELDFQWLCSAFKRAQASLEERYSPEDHVEVSAVRALSGLQRGARFRAELLGFIRGITQALPRDRHDLDQEVLDALERLSSSAESLSSYAPKALTDFGVDFPYQDYVGTTAQVQGHARALSDIVQNNRPPLSDAHTPSHASQVYDAAISEAWQVSAACDDLLTFLASNVCQADRSRFALLTGRAGTGKSHLLAAEVDRLTSEGVPALLLLGSHFTDTLSLAGQIPSIVGLGCDLETLLGAMSARSESMNSRAVLAIDAINEGGGSDGEVS